MTNEEGRDKSRRDGREEFDPARIKADLFALACFKAPEELRKTLKVDEHGYRFVSGSGHFHARDYYVYGVLDEIEKAGVAILQFQECLSGNSKDKEADRLTQIFLASTLDEQSLWMRKLAEILVEVISFRKTNRVEYFKHYLLVRELVDERKKDADFRDFYGCDNQNVKRMIKELDSRITNVETHLDLGKCWYLKSRKPSVTHKFSDFRSRLSNTLKSYTDGEKLILNLSYWGGYTKPSSSLHVNIGGIPYDLSKEKLESNISRIGLLSAYIVLNCKKLVRCRAKGFLQQLQRLLEREVIPKQVMDQKVRPKITRGDFVVAAGNLAQVNKVIRNPVGYRAFKVTYLLHKPSPNPKEDTLPAPYVSPLFKKREIMHKVKTEIKQHAPAVKISDKRLVAASRNAVIKLWEKLGLKEQCFGRPDLAQKKIEAFLEESHNLKNDRNETK